MLNGATTDLSADVVLEHGVVFLGTDPIGVTVGGCSFDPKKVIRNLEYDGKRSNVVGLDRIIKYDDPTISGTLIEFGGAATGAQISRIEQAISAAVQTGGSLSPKGIIKTYTPKAAGAFFSSGEYATDLRLIFEQPGGLGYIAILFANAFVQKYGPIQGADGGEVKVPFEFCARLSAALSVSAPGTCPYVIEQRSALPS